MIIALLSQYALFSIRHFFRMTSAAVMLLSPFASCRSPRPSNADSLLTIVSFRIRVYASRHSLRPRIEKNHWIHRADRTIRKDVHHVVPKKPAIVMVRAYVGRHGRLLEAVFTLQNWKTCVNFCEQSKMNLYWYQYLM